MECTLRPGDLIAFNGIFIVYATRIDYEIAIKAKFVCNIDIKKRLLLNTTKPSHNRR